MKTKIIATTICCALPALLLGRIIWPDPMGMIQPTTAQFIPLAFVAISEALLFGLGVSFVFFGWPLLRNVNPAWKKLTLATFISISWMLLAWWPHDNMHRSNGMDINGLIRIDLLFHVTLIIAAVIIAKYFIVTIKENRLIK